MVAWSFPPSPERAAPMMGGAAWGRRRRRGGCLSPRMHRPRCLGRARRDGCSIGSGENCGGVGSAWNVGTPKRSPCCGCTSPTWRVWARASPLPAGMVGGGTGAMLAPCSDLELAVSRVMTSLVR